MLPAGRGPPTAPPSPPGRFDLDDDDEFEDADETWAAVTQKGSAAATNVGGSAMADDLDAEFDAEFDDERAASLAQQTLGQASVRTERTMPVWLQGTPIAKHSSSGGGCCAGLAASCASLSGGDEGGSCAGAGAAGRSKPAAAAAPGAGVAACASSAFSSSSGSR